MAQLLRAVAGADIAAARQRTKLEQLIAALERRGKRLKRLRKRLKHLESGRSKPRVRVPARRLEVVP